MKIGSTPIKSGSTMFARGVVLLIGLAALAVCGILLPELAREATVEDPASTHLTYSFLVGAYILAIPFFVALYQSHKLLGLIDKNKVFSDQSIKILQTIKMCAIVFGILVIGAVAAGIAIARSVNSQEDVTFMIPLGFIGIFVPGVIAVFVAVLQKLLADAVSLKSENDLIV